MKNERKNTAGNKNFFLENIAEIKFDHFTTEGSLYGFWSLRPSVPRETIEKKKRYSAP